jgi:hypothetical protein
MAATLLITVQTPDGGTLVYGTYLDGQTIGLRLLVPAAGAENRPYAFWIKRRPPGARDHNPAGNRPGKRRTSRARYRRAGTPR